MASMTLKDYLVARSTQDPAIIDDLIKTSGILQTATVRSSSHGLVHKYKKVSSLPTGTFVGIGGSATDRTIEKELAQTDLKRVVINQSEPYELVDNYPGGPQAYFDENLYAFMEGMGNTIASQAVYGTISGFGQENGFKGLHQYAKEFGNVTQLGGASGSSTSIFVVRWNPNYSAMLVPKDMGDLVNIRLFNDGKPVQEVVNTATGAKKTVYQVQYYSELGQFHASNFTVSAITQIDSTHTPTAAQLENAINQVKGSSANNTFIYLNRIGKSTVNKLKDGKFNTVPADRNYDFRVDAFNSIPLILEENIRSDETSVLD